MNKMPINKVKDLIFGVQNTRWTKKKPREYCKECHRLIETTYVIDGICIECLQNKQRKFTIDMINLGI